ncbi:MAG: hypothetical protein ACOXZ4_04950 [Sphaerochaetaceae bacterium]
MEQSTEGSRNSLLKMLEEPAQKTYIMLLSEHPSRLLPTILSRTQHHRIKPFSKEEKNKLLSTLFLLILSPILQWSILSLAKLASILPNYKHSLNSLSDPLILNST